MKPGTLDAVFNQCATRCSVRTASQHNEADGVPSTAMSHVRELYAIFSPIKPFNLPDIWLNSSILQGLHCFQHQLRTQLQIKCILVAFQPLQAASASLALAVRTKIVYVSAASSQISDATD